MRNNYITVILSFIAAATGVSKGFAADSLSHRRPVAILVQLSSERNRIAALSKAGRTRDAEEVKNDGQHVAQATINDFRDHFKYCPVYYYVDTNAEAILNKQFEGILLNADGSVTHNPIINTRSTNYYIVYYGYPNVQLRKAAEATDESSPAPGRGLIVLNDSYKQVAYSIDPDYTSLFSKKKGKYSYTSKHFNIQYRPYALELNDKLSGKDKGNFRGHLDKRHKID